MDHLVTMTVQSKQNKDENDETWEGQSQAFTSFVLLSCIYIDYPSVSVALQKLRWFIEYLQISICHLCNASETSRCHSTQTSPTKSQQTLEKSGL